jgi:hypothetical protein
MVVQFDFNNPATVRACPRACPVPGDHRGRLHKFFAKLNHYPLSAFFVKFPKTVTDGRYAVKPIINYLDPKIPL